MSDSFLGERLAVTTTVLSVRVVSCAYAAEVDKPTANKPNPKVILAYFFSMYD